MMNKFIMNFFPKSVLVVFDFLSSLGKVIHIDVLKYLSLDKTRLAYEVRIKMEFVNNFMNRIDVLKYEFY